MTLFALGFILGFFIGMGVLTILLALYIGGA